MAPDSPEIIAEELRNLAEANTAEIPEIAPHETIEWDAAAKLDTATRALRVIKAGADDPVSVATVALWSMNDE